MDDFLVVIARRLGRNTATWKDVALFLWEYFDCPRPDRREGIAYMRVVGCLMHELGLERDEAYDAIDRMADIGLMAVYEPWANRVDDRNVVTFPVGRRRS